VTVSTVFRRPEPATRTQTWRLSLRCPCPHSARVPLPSTYLPHDEPSVRRGRTVRFESLTLGLAGTNPRSPWKRSATMLLQAHRHHRAFGSTTRNAISTHPSHRGPQWHTAPNLRAPRCVSNTAPRCSPAGTSTTYSPRLDRIRRCVSLFSESSRNMCGVLALARPSSIPCPHWSGPLVVSTSDIGHRRLHVWRECLSHAHRVHHGASTAARPNDIRRGRAAQQPPDEPGSSHRR
jgi:hypothetical protein